MFSQWKSWLPYKPLQLSDFHWVVKRHHHEAMFSLWLFSGCITPGRGWDTLYWQSSGESQHWRTWFIWLKYTFFKELMDHLSIEILCLDRWSYRYGDWGFLPIPGSNGILMVRELPADTLHYILHRTLWFDKWLFPSSDIPLNLAKETVCAISILQLKCFNFTFDREIVSNPTWI